MIKLFALPALLLAVGVAGCSTLACGDPHPYINSESRPLLKAAPGLSVPAADPNYAIQGISPDVAKRTDRDAAGVCLINPPQLVSTPRATAPKLPATGSKSAPLPPSGSNKLPAKPADESKTPAPSPGTGVVPFPVAAADNIG